MRHEPRDLSLRAILIWSAAFAVIVVVAAIAIWTVFSQNLPKTAKPTLFPAPQLQGEPRQDLARLRAHETEMLTTSGPNRIPIEQAMKETAR